MDSMASTVETYKRTMIPTWKTVSGAEVVVGVVDDGCLELFGVVVWCYF